MAELWAKEFNGFLDSLVAYVVVGVFLIVMGTLMWVFPDTSVWGYGYADMSALFTLGPYAFIFLVPAITMRSFAEEKKLGTLDFLFTKPVSDWAIIGAKFLACYALVALSTVPCFVYGFSVYRLGDPVGNMDIAGALTSYLGLLLLGGTFCAVGIWASSIAASQMVAFVLTGFICLALYIGIDMLSSLFTEGTVALRIKQWGIAYHYESMSRGLIDSRDVIYFLSLIALAMGLTRLGLRNRRA